MALNVLKATVLLLLLPSSSLLPGNGQSSPINSGKINLVFLGLSPNMISSPVVRLVCTERPRGLSNNAYNGALAKKGMIKALLEANNIRAVLRLLWAEKDRELKLVVLKALAQEGYAIFMLELASHIVHQSPEEALFWFMAGFIRSFQDIVSFVGTNEQSTQEICMLAAIYGRLINVKGRFTRQQATQARRAAIHFLKQSTTFPSPAWISPTPGDNALLEPQVKMQYLRSKALENLHLEDAIWDCEAVQPARHICAECGFNGSKMIRCSNCKKSWYCNRGCQSTHWGIHKQMCKPTQGGQ